jgi:heme A synthase
MIGGTAMFAALVLLINWVVTGRDVPERFLQLFGQILVFLGGALGAVFGANTIATMRPNGHRDEIDPTVTAELPLELKPRAPERISDGIEH